MNTKGPACKMQSLRRSTSGGSLWILSLAVVLLVWARGMAAEVTRSLATPTSPMDGPARSWIPTAEEQELASRIREELAKDRDLPMTHDRFVRAVLALEDSKVRKLRPAVVTRSIGAFAFMHYPEFKSNLSHRHGIATAVVAQRPGANHILNVHRIAGHPGSTGDAAAPATYFEMGELHMSLDAKGRVEVSVRLPKEEAELVGVAGQVCEGLVVEAFSQEFKLISRFEGSGFSLSYPAGCEQISASCNVVPEAEMKSLAAQNAIIAVCYRLRVQVGDRLLGTGASCKFESAGSPEAVKWMVTYRDAFETNMALINAMLLVWNELEVKPPISFPGKVGVAAEPATPVQKANEGKPVAITPSTDRSIPEASSSLKVADLYLANGLREKALERYRQIVNTYPGTKEAKAAAEKIKQMQ